MRGVFLIGPPGAGKTTQGALLAQSLGGVHLSMGELVRGWRAAGVPVPSPRADGAAARDRTLALLAEAVPQTELLVLDGFPRTASQAAWLVDITPGGACLVEIRAPLSECIARMKSRGRDGEDMATIALRHDSYQQAAVAVCGAVGRLGLPLSIVDGEGGAEQVHARIRAALADQRLAVGEHAPAQ